MKVATHAPSWGERIFGLLAFAFVGFVITMYVFTDTHEVDALILATRQSVFGW